MKHRNRLVLFALVVLLLLLSLAPAASAEVVAPDPSDIPAQGDTSLAEPPAEESVDDDLLVEIPQEEMLAQIVNGDFSDADMFDTFWTNDVFVSDASTFSRYDMDGNWCASIISKEPNDARLEQDIDVDPLSTYLIRARVLAKDVLSQGEFGANLGIRGVYGGSLSLYDTNGAWQELTLYAQTGPEQYTMTLSLCLGGYGSLATGSVWFDDVTIEKTDGVPAGAASVYAEVSPDTEPPIPEEVPASESADDVRNLVLIALFAVLSGYGLYRLFAATAFSREPTDRRQTSALVVGVLGLAFIVRATLALVTKGHPTDISCFTAWSQLIVEHGIKDFYTSGFFADYPPGYMYVLYVIGGIKQLLNINNEAVYSALVRLPAILADLAAAYVLYRYARKKWNVSVALALLAIVAFNPTAILNSAAWAQIDSILSLLLIAVFLLISDKRFIAAAAVFGAAALIKPQALMAGPVFALPYIFAFFDEDTKKRALPKLLLSVLAAAGVIALGALPFTGTQEPRWLLDKYFGTMEQYPYASIHAFNLFSLLGGNWKEQATLIGPLSFEQWGMIGIALSLGAMVYFAIVSRKKGTLSYPLLTSFLLTALFTLAHNMHERYAFPALFLIALAYIELRDVRLIRSLCMFVATTFINIASVLIVSQTPAEVAEPFMVLTRIGSALSVLAFGYFAYVCFDLFVNGRVVEKLKIKQRPPQPAAHEQLLTLEPVKKRVLMKLDVWIMLALTGVYAVVAFVNLGTTKVPVSYWRAGEQSQVITVDFDKTYDISSIWSYGGISDAMIEINAVSEDGAVTKAADVNVNYDVMFRWQTTDAVFSAKQLVIDIPKGQPWINELAFLDTAGRPVPIESVQVTGTSADDADSDITHLFDEQSRIPDRPSVRNGMYFDELYHARTALEHLKGLEPYENSHPPLGKVFIMLGIMLFGMTPFGWRFSGTLFGVLMVPLMYMFGKRLFKRTDFALFTSFMMAFDFMHFVQTRIATIDVYGVFFIILMYYFMYRYFEMNFFVDGLKKTLVPLGLCGISFGLGAASKWIGIYAGGGLAVLLFVSLFSRYREYRSAQRAAENGEPDAERAVALTKNFWRSFLLTGAFCVAFFIVIPACIYLLSYLPYVLCKAKPYNLAGIWDVQKFMYNYHSTLTATHPFESKWYTWPVMAKPIWYYMGTHLPQGTVEGIFAMGNPAVWWSGLVGLLVVIGGQFDRSFANKRAAFLLIGFAAQFLPWTLITRATFIYHYFASVPFIIFALALVLEQFEKIYRIKWLKYALMGAALLLFAAFYPALAGTPIPVWYADMLRWFGSWVFYVK